MIVKHRHPLIPHLSSLKSEVESRYRDEKRRLYLAQPDLEPLSYSPEAACHALKNLLETAKQLAKEYEGFGKTVPGVLVAMRHRDLFPFMVDNFLEAARRANWSWGATLTG